MLASPRILKQSKAGSEKKMSSMRGEMRMEEEEDNDEDYCEDSNNNKKKRGSSHTGKKGSSSGGSAQPSCQVEACATDMTNCKAYHRRHKVCEYHAKAPVVIIAGLRQRFCQQCSRFHDLSEFDDAKRSCRRRLAGHNERRRKSSYETYGEGSG